MTMLLRLYPRRWRERYEEEVLDLLADRPASLSDGLDLVRGALDAHLHPQAVSHRAAQPWTHRIPGTIALAAGLVWTTNATWMIARADPGDGWASVVGILFVLMLICLPGDYLLAGHGRRIAIGLAAIAICFAALQVLPWWPVGLGVGLIGYVIMFAGALGLAALRAGIGSTGRWRLVTLALVLPIVLAVPSTMGVLDLGAAPWVAVAVFLPYGLAWLLIGSLLVIRGAPTIIDHPSASTHPQRVNLETPT